MLEALAWPTRKTSEAMGKENTKARYGNGNGIGMEWSGVESSGWGLVRGWGCE